MPFPVAQLIEGHLDPVIVYREDPAIKALNLMITYDYSQLPVVDYDYRPIGMVNYEGIIRSLRNFKTQLDELHVRDVMSGAPIFQLDDDLFELLEQLKQTNAVLIKNSEGQLTGIVTSYDSTEYFRNRAENMMRVEDIEALIKDFILIAYDDENGSRDDEKLRLAISHVTPSDDTFSKGLKSFDDLTLGQYISLLTSKETWSFLGDILQIPRAALIKLFDDVRNTRNDLAHFRDDISVERADQLRFCADWLARCWDEYHDKFKDELRVYLPGFEEEPIVGEEGLSEGMELILTPSQDKEKSIADKSDFEVIAEESRTQESRYSLLIDYLQSQPGRNKDVIFSFEDIEKILNGELPASAYNHRAWWANDAQGHPHALLWLEAGWRTSYVNLTDQCVTFIRIHEREKAYIDFFSKLLNELRKHADFPVRQISPDGTSWAVCQSIAPTGYVVGQFNYSFARSRQFRIELYLDTLEQKSTKEIYDGIYARRDDIEVVFGMINWERINDKRASRIAIYHPGAITDSKEQLAALREWAVPTMITFYKTLEPIATQAALEVLKA